MKTHSFNAPKIFDSQINNLEEKAAPAGSLKHLKHLKDKLLDLDWQDKDYSTPFLPVIPFSVWPFAKQIQGVGFYHKNCLNRLNHENDIMDLPDIPEKPYYLVGVNEGSEWTKHELTMAKNNFLAKGFLGLTAAELFSLARYTGILAKHNIAALNSYYKITDEIIILEIEKNQPVVSSINISKHGKNIAAPFALERLS